MRHRSRCSVALAALSLLLTFTVAVAAGAQTRTQVVLVDIEAPTRPELPWRLVAQSQTADGAPVNGATIRFSVVTFALGERTAFLGEATTDAAGIARLNLVPRREHFTIRAELTGSDAYASSTATQELTVPTDAVEPSGIDVETASLLEPVQDLMPTAISGAVAVLWVLIIGLAAHTVAATRRAAAAVGAVANGATPVPGQTPREG